MPFVYGGNLLEMRAPAFLRRRDKLIVLVAIGTLVATSCSQSAEPVPTTTIGEPVAEVACGELFSSTDVPLNLAEVSTVSGLVASRVNPGIYWMAGKLRGEVRLWAMGDNASTLGSLVLPETFENVIDITIGPGPDGEALYLALGDPDPAVDVLRVVRIDEPDPAAPKIESEPVVLQYAWSGRRTDVTGLLVDPTTGELYVVGQTGRRSLFHLASPPLPGETIGELAAIAAVDGRVTDADMSVGGDAIVIRTLFDVAVWQRRSQGTLATALASAPCVGLFADEHLRGAVSFDVEGHNLVTLQPTLQPSFHVYAIPPVGASGTGADPGRAANLAPRVTIEGLAPGPVAIDGMELEIRAAITDDTPVQTSNVTWKLETRQCSETGDCTVSDVEFETGNPIVATPSVSPLGPSEYVIAVKYIDDHDQTATDQLVVPLELPEPIAGSSVSFSGGRVDAGDIEGLTDDMTIEMWVRPEDLSVRRVVAGKAYSGEGLVIHEIDGRLNYYHGEAGDNCCDGTYIGFNSQAVLPLNEWSHVVITRNVTRGGGTLRFFIDGVQTNTQPIWMAPSDSTLPWLIGNGYRDGFSGAIDEVAIYGRELTRTEITSHFEAIDDPDSYARVVLGDGPVGYWRLDEPSGWLARDETGTWNGTYSGSVVGGMPGAGAS